MRKADMRKANKYHDNSTIMKSEREQMQNCTEKVKGKNSSPAKVSYFTGRIASFRFYALDGHLGHFTSKNV